MPDLSRLSDSDLAALSKNDMSSISDEGLNHLSAPEPTGIMNDYVKPALGLVNSATNKLYSYTGAPAMSAIAEEEKNGLGGHPISAFMNQFGKDPSTAPSGKDILSGAGINLPEKEIPNFPSPAVALAKGLGYHPTYNDVAGGLVEAAVNPLNFIPGVGEAKLAAEGAEGASNLGSMAKYAGKKAVAATGATAREAAEFAPEAGQELLKQKIVRFGNSQGRVSEKLDKALEKSGKAVGGIVDDLTSKGATVDQQDVVNSIRSRASEVGQRASGFKLSDELNRTADRLQSTIESSGGNSEIPLKDAEIEKKVFQDIADKSYGNPLDFNHAKELGSIYRQAVEDSATKFDPASAKTFLDEKKNFKLLIPIQEAAKKRALQLQQSPAGGFMDTAAIAAGAAMGGGPGAVIAPVARKMLSSRIAPSMAATAHALSSTPNVGSAIGGARGLMQANPALSGLLNTKRNQQQNGK